MTGSEIETLRSGLRILALRALGDPDQAEEVAQETLARTVAALRDGRLTDGARLGAFARGIARHVIIDTWRARGGRPSGSAGDPPGSDPYPPAPGPDALQSLVHAEQRERVRAALGRLSPGDRAILRLTFYLGLRPAEVAARLGEPPARIRKRKSRALARLRDALSGSLRSRDDGSGEYSAGGSEPPASEEEG